MAQDVTAAIGILAGLLLCLAVIVTAIRRFRRDSDVGDLLAALLAAVVALANKLARTAWAIAAHHTEFEMKEAVIAK